jgi:hypothetical protein
VQQVIALYRFWPDVAARVRAAINVPLGPDPARPGTQVVAVLPLRGTFDLACVIEAPDGAEALGCRALEAAEAVGAGRLFRDAEDHWSALLHPAPAAPVAPGAEPFASVPADVGIWLLRAMDGWDLVATPDRPAWLSMSMTFLRKRFYFAHDHRSAWRSSAVNELATLVLGTHRAEDVEGTSQTYDIPCAAVRAWLDEAQAETAAGERSLEATRSSQLASVLQYAALLRLDLPPGVSSSAAAELAAERLRVAGGSDILVADDACATSGGAA